MGRTVNIQTTITFENIMNSKSRVVHNIGGTRSSKSYSALQYCIVKAMESPHNITIVRKTIPSLKRTVMKDLKDILTHLELWNDNDFNITDRIWTYNNSSIQFISTDDAEKLRGVKSDILYIDEASEIDEEAYFQLAIRTSGKIILTYNPTISPVHWLRKMEDCDRYITTYKDNPFLPADMVKAIEELEFKSPKKWIIYGKGEYAPNDASIFEFDLTDKLEGELIGYGMDFGYSQDPTSLVALYKQGDTLTIQELLYERGLITNDIITKLRGFGINREEIWCDSAEPRLIDEIYRGGFNAKPVKKGADSINFGISVLQNYKLLIHSKSQNLINEMYSYQWATDKYGYQLDKPDGGLDHAIDAARYCAMMKLTKQNQNKGVYAISVR
jgi:phage terminase large subunit